MVQRVLPGVSVNERDLSAQPLAGDTSVGAMVLDCTRGPINEARLITTTNEFIETYGLPTSGARDRDDLHYALAFLARASRLWVVRSQSNDSYAYAVLQKGGEPAAVRTTTQLDSNVNTVALENTDSLSIFTTNPGSWGNSIRVRFSSVGTDGSARVEVQESISGSYITRELFEVSFVTAATNDLGENIYIDNVINNQSNYIRVNAADFSTGSAGPLAYPIYGCGLSDSIDVPGSNSATVFADELTANIDRGTVSVVYTDDNTAAKLTLRDDGAGNLVQVDSTSTSLIASGSISYSTGAVSISFNSAPAEGNILVTYCTAVNVDLDNGASRTSNSTSNQTQTSWNIFRNLDLYNNIDLLVDTSGNSTVQSAIISIAEAREDCLAVLSVPLSSDNATAMRSHRDNLNNSSYAALYAPGVVIQSSYTNERINLMSGPFAAAVLASIDPYQAAAGYERAVLSVSDLVVRLEEGSMELLYENEVNPIRRVQGRGVVIWGNRTLKGGSAATSRIPARRTLAVINTSVRESLQDVVFEINDDFTRTRVEQSITRFLRTLGPGLTDFRVVCDATNNPPEVIDAGQLNCLIAVQIPRQAEFIQLDIVVTATGISFSEVLSS